MISRGDKVVCELKELKPVGCERGTAAYQKGVLAFEEAIRRRRTGSESSS